MWPNTQFPADLVTFTEEIRNGRLNFLYSEGKNWHEEAKYNMFSSCPNLYKS